MAYFCKNGEHQILPNVYVLPCLTTNVVSIGQLNKSEYLVLIEDGVMHTRDEEGVCSRRSIAT
jgi:hypothetical protein